MKKSAQLYIEEKVEINNWVNNSCDEYGLTHGTISPIFFYIYMYTWTIFGGIIYFIYTHNLVATAASMKNGRVQ